MTRLRLRKRYDEPLARRLAIARSLREETGMPLARAYALAGEAVAADPYSLFERTSDDGAVIIRVDLPRFYTDYQVRLSRARTHVAERVRGRQPKRRRGSAVERAQAYGWDVTLLDSNLRLTEEERLAQLDAAAGELHKLRGTLWKKAPGR